MVTSGVILENGVIKGIKGIKGTVEIEHFLNSVMDGSDFFTKMSNAAKV